MKTELMDRAMLKFMRNKTVGIERRDKETLWAYGVLDDDIYGVELEVSIGLSDMVIRSIEGRFKRWTTPECPKAIPVLQQAVGFCALEEGFSQKVQKNIGRKGCRHFANLLVECCGAAEQAANLIRGGKPEKIPAESKTSGGRKQKEAERHPEKSLGKTIEARGEDRRGVVIDLHVHTYPASPCSVARVDDVILEAKRIGLEGICLTDHNYVWDKGTVDELSHKHDFLVLRGNEITTDQGDMLVFGLETPIRSIIKLDELRTMVLEAEGFIIAAHPFRGFLLFGSGQLGLTAEKAMERPLFKQVDGIEVLNSKVTEKENRFALEVAEGTGHPGTGGSDAHQVSDIGLYATRFFSKITSERELIDALRGGRYEAVAFKKGKDVF
jgi:predicted metal-dependent phosphoesterase TrpH